VARLIVVPMPNFFCDILASLPATHRLALADQHGTMLKSNLHVATLSDSWCDFSFKLPQMPSVSQHLRASSVFTPRTHQVAALVR
jgi:hypothetical protein